MFQLPTQEKLGQVFMCMGGKTLRAGHLPAK
jgi:hypothetical protein